MNTHSDSESFTESVTPLVCSVTDQIKSNQTLFIVTKYAAAAEVRRDRRRRCTATNCRNDEQCGSEDESVRTPRHMQWGQRGQAFGLAVAAWQAARRFIEVLAQSFMKSLKSASHTDLHTSLSFAEASNSERWMLHFCKVTLIWCDKRFLGPPADCCPCDSSL